MKLEGGEKNPRKASIDAMGEISGAIISITLVMAAVFIPITFIKGPAGVFYEQFGVTLIIAILISALNALTLSPALCAIFLKPPKKKKKAKEEIYCNGFTSHSMRLLKPQKTSIRTPLVFCFVINGSRF